jgi:protein gp37
MAGRFKKEQKPLYLDDVEATTDMGDFKSIFVCSGCDLFHPDIPDLWIEYVGQQAFDFSMNTYVLHTKNPERAVKFYVDFPIGTILCATIETDRDTSGISKAPPPAERIEGLKKWPAEKMITIEPIMDFDITKFAILIDSCKPVQTNIGADSGHNNLPEPSREKVEELIKLLAPHTKIHLKNNLRRILPESRYYGNP